MIEELKDDEILEYLMTSDFIENYRPEEYKFLLHKFRYFYRLLYGNYNRHKGEKEFENKQLIESIESVKKQIETEQTKSAKLQDHIDLSKKERILTWRERLSGKINKIDDDVKTTN